MTGEKKQTAEEKAEKARVAEAKATYRKALFEGVPHKLAAPGLSPAQQQAVIDQFEEDQENQVL